MTERRSLDIALLLWGVFGVCVSGLILLMTSECEAIAGKTGTVCLSKRRRGGRKRRRIASPLCLRQGKLNSY